MNFDCKEQLAGIASIDFYLLSETGSWPEIITDTNAGGITIYTTNISTPEVDGSIEPESIRINDQPKLDASGQIWSIDISFTYLSRGLNMELLLEKYANQAGIARACFNDGSKKQFGTNLEPLYLTWENNYGVKIEDSHGVNIRIKGEMSRRPVYILKNTQT